MSQVDAEQQAGGGYEDRCSTRFYRSMPKHVSSGTAPIAMTIVLPCRAANMFGIATARTHGAKAGTQVWLVMVGCSIMTTTMVKQCGWKTFTTAMPVILPENYDLWVDPAFSNAGP
jgi:hypothetical protein